MTDVQQHGEASTTTPVIASFTIPRKRTGRKPLPPGAKRMVLGLAVTPEAAAALKACAQRLGIGHGRTLDRAITDLANSLLR
jgi:hypothetical protein